jgi:hypothetical protein
MRHMIRCKHLNKFVPANPRSKDQKYCGCDACQQIRKTKWQREKMKTDPQYRVEQEKTNDRWLKKNPDYWKNYRARHPDYCRQNREKQKQRDRKRKEKAAKMDPSTPAADKMDTLDGINDIISSGYSDTGNNLAKMDALGGIDHIKPGIYQVSSLNPDLAKMDTLNQKVIIIPIGYIDLAKMDKIDITENSIYQSVKITSKQEVNYVDHKEPDNTG